MPSTSSKSEPDLPLPADAPQAGPPPPARPRSRWRAWAAQFTAGGRWTDRLPGPTRRNLRWFWLDGVFAQATESISLAYTVLYVLALGATRAQIGLMSSLSSLSAALLLLPGATLANQRGRRKLICLTSGGAVRAAMLLLALTPLVFSGPAGVVVAIALVVVREAFANLVLPAWTALSADLVPVNWRGRYFSSRNFAMGVAGMVITLFVGQVINLIGSPAGYQVAFGLAFASGLVSIYCFARLTEPLPAAPSVEAAPAPASRPSLLRHVRANPDFIAFCASAAVWNFSLNVAGPFFNVYVVENLRGDAGIVGLLSVVSSLASLPGQRVFGPLTDRWGPRRVQLLTSLLIPIVPVAWVFVTASWHIIPINLMGGFLWAGFLLASFNLLLAISPEDQRPAFTAIYQIVVLASLAAGAAFGGWVVTHFGYSAIFLLSGVGRLAAALLFARFVRAGQAAVAH